MEGGVEKIVSFSYLVYVIIGLAIGPAIEKLVEYVDIVLSYQETLNSLKAKVEDLTTIISLLQKQYPSDDIERQGSSAVEKWAVKLRHLHRDASAMEQNIARINVVSRYRASNEMKQKISEMEKYLKLFPLIQLKLVLRRSRKVGDFLDQFTRPRLKGHPADIVHKLATELIKRAAKSILRRIQMVIYFNRAVASLEDLVASIMPIVREICDEIPQNDDDVYPAINRWSGKMFVEVRKAEQIKSLPWWNVIRRYKGTKDVANLISTIEAHMKSASLMTLEPIFREKMDQLPQKKLRPSVLQSMRNTAPHPQPPCSTTPSKKPKPTSFSVSSHTIGQQASQYHGSLELPQKKLGPSASVISLEPASLFQETIDLESSSQQKKLRPSAQVVETFIEVDASNDEGLRAP